MILYQAALPSSQEIEKSMESILSRPEFAPKQSLIEAFLAWLGSWINKLLEWLGLDKIELYGGTSPWVAVVIIVIIVALLGLLLWVILRRFRKASSPKRKIDATGEYQELIALEGSAKALAQAGEALAQGNWKRMARSLYMASLWAYQEKGILELDEARTARQYGQLLHQLGVESAQAYRGLVDAYNRVWYGNKDSDEQQMRYWLDWVEALCRGGKRP